MAKTKGDGDCKKASGMMRSVANEGYLAYIEWSVYLGHWLKQVEQHLSLKVSSAREPSPETAPIADQLAQQLAVVRSKREMQVASPIVQPEEETAAPGVLPIPHAAVRARAAICSAEGFAMWREG